MEKLLVMGSSTCSDDIIKYARSIGVYTIVSDYLPVEESFAKPLADESWQIDLKDLDALEKKCREEGVTAVICGISEFCQDQTIELCERLGLPCYCTKDSWHYNRNKADFKEACKSVGLPVAEDFSLSDLLSDEEIECVQYPVVVKPVDCGANNGISFCNNKEELINAYHYARSVSDNPKIIVEHMLHGEELTGLYALADGEASLVGIDNSFKQPGEAEYCYSANTTVSKYTMKYIRETDPFVKRFLKKIGCREGFVWIECMYDEESDCIYAIEMGYRLSGDMIMNAIRSLNEFDAIKWVTDYALGQKHEPEDLPVSITSPRKKCACSYLIWTNKTAVVESIDGIDEISSAMSLPVRRFLKTGKEIEKYSYAFIIPFAADNCEEMCNILAKINNTISAKDTDGNDILLRFTDYDKIKKAYTDSFKEV